MKTGHLKPVAMLPNLLTLANAGCGLLAISKSIDALVAGPELFHAKFETACWLIFLAMIFDALDGMVARLTDSFSDFGAQLDSLADALTFGFAPAILAKVLLGHDGSFHPRLEFLAAAAFALMAVLRLARFNLETEHDEGSHRYFAGLPSPAAAGTLVAMMLMYLSLGGDIEVVEGTPTPVGRGIEFLPTWLRDVLVAILVPTLFISLPLLGLAMVSRIRYAHVVTVMFRGQERVPTLVKIVFIALGLYLAPVPVLFFTGVTYVLHGVVRSRLPRRDRVEDRQAA